MRNCDAETADAKLGYGSEKIAELAHQKWEIDGVHAARRESRVVQQRRKRVADGIANHTVDPRAARESVGAVEMNHVVE